jgi:hypothetical protein
MQRLFMFQIWSPGGSRKFFEMGLRAVFHGSKFTVFQTHMESDSMWVYYVFADAKDSILSIKENLDTIKVKEDIASRMCVELKDLVPGDFIGDMLPKGFQTEALAKDFMALLETLENANAVRLGYPTNEAMKKIQEEINHVS